MADPHRAVGILTVQVLPTDRPEPGQRPRLRRLPLRGEVAAAAILARPTGPQQPGSGVAMGGRGVPGIDAAEHLPRREQKDGGGEPVAAQMRAFPQGVRTQLVRQVIQDGTALQRTALVPLGVRADQQHGLARGRLGARGAGVAPGGEPGQEGRRVLHLEPGHPSAGIEIPGDEDGERVVADGVAGRPADQDEPAAHLLDQGFEPAAHRRIKRPGAGGGLRAPRAGRLEAHPESGARRGAPRRRPGG